MPLTISRRVKFKIEILEAKMIMKVAKIGRSKKMCIIDLVYYYIDTILYSVIFFRSSNFCNLHDHFGL